MNDVPLTRIDWVEAQIRQAILDGELAPGERLITAALSERFAVSPTPLREALQRLAGEGLVEFAAQRGARVTPLSARDRGELAELRTLLEPETAAQAAQHGGPEWRALVESASARLLATLDQDDATAVARELAYRAFYEAVASACPSARLRTMSRVVRDQSARYRLAVGEGLDREESAALHRSLVEALLTGRVPDVRTAIEKELAISESVALGAEQEAVPAGGGG
ncbi:GntR family transcriptional regulator [Geodermatophilus nigrescens]|uniref:GntR family transcriptional regulator n=1 Tax=Geodermatophilus sp. FMUSA9-8 TaxID=3120155 RepID=UPI0030080476